MGESRQELLAWLNGLLQLNLTKIEQCGTGYGYLPFSLASSVPIVRSGFEYSSITALAIGYGLIWR
ncbi:hypothetical protein AWENTII_001342 [Aspergillus wentii]